MIDNIYDVILLTLGLFCGRVVFRILIYKVIHPYITVPYLKRKEERKEKREEMKA